MGKSVKHQIKILLFPRASRYRCRSAAVARSRRPTLIQRMGVTTCTICSRNNGSEKRTPLRTTAPGARLGRPRPAARPILKHQFLQRIGNVFWLTTKPGLVTMHTTQMDSAPARFYHVPERRRKISFGQPDGEIRLYERSRRVLRAKAIRVQFRPSGAPQSSLSLRSQRAHFSFRRKGSPPTKVGAYDGTGFLRFQFSTFCLYP